ncbi:hypothetical protein [Acidiphilium angustum]|uniref:hypothetical protein n=1 Tax=Acidiphilium angustum TaxID=523 RepID=UPI0004943797|nr:hypothetical protein [Acidiphilium angustum]
MSISHVPNTKMRRAGAPTEHEAALSESADRARAARDVMFAAIRSYAATLTDLRREFPHDIYMTNPEQVIRDICGVLTGSGVPFDGMDAISDSRGMH